MSELRFGTAARLYYDSLNLKLPGQLDLLDAWFPSLIIEEIPSDGETKTDAEYSDMDFRIRAVKYHDSFYAGGSRRVSQITGRLTGTAKGNQEKERRTAFLIQKHLSGRLVSELPLLPVLQEAVLERMEQMDDDQLDQFYGRIFDYIEALVSTREANTEYELLTELFPMDHEVFDGILYNTVYQLVKQTRQSISNGYLWLLIGGLLRNESGRVLRMYDSSFVPIRRQSTEDGTLRDKLYFLIHPEEYEAFYEGDDLDRRFPGIEWFCDRCKDYLNTQPGFTDQNPVWVCTKCGYENRLDADVIYDSREDYDNQLRPMGEEALKRAVEERKKKCGKK